MMTLPMTAKVKLLTGSKKRNFFLSQAETVAPRGGWCGGSCSYFSGLNYKTGADVELKEGDNFSVQTTRQELPKDTIMITTSVFNGKPGTPTITCRPDETDAVLEWLGCPKIV